MDGEFRVRLSSIEAAEVTPELLDLMAEHPQRICPHLHVPMQSGSDAILRKMRRRWPVRRFIDRCLEIRDRLDQPALTTDVIVGFPGRNRGRFCRDVPGGGGSGIFQDSRVSLQSAARHRGRRHAQPSAATNTPAPGGRIGRTGKASLRLDIWKNSKERTCKCWWKVDCRIRRACFWARPTDM